MTDSESSKSTWSTFTCNSSCTCLTPRFGAHWTHNYCNIFLVCFLYSFVYHLVCQGFYEPCLGLLYRPVLTYSEIRCSALSYCSGSSNMQVRVSRYLSSNNSYFTKSDLHLHRTSSLIWLSKFSPKLKSFPSFLNPVTNWKTVSPSFCWSWWNFWWAKSESIHSVLWQLQT